LLRRNGLAVDLPNVGLYMFIKIFTNIQFDNNNTNLTVSFPGQPG